MDIPKTHKAKKVEGGKKNKSAKINEEETVLSNTDDKM